MANLISLRHLLLDTSNELMMIPKLGQLTSLRTLSQFYLGGEKGCQIEDVGSMKHLCGELSIRNLENINSKEEATKADLFGKKKLYEISLIWSRAEGRNEKDVLEGLQPHADVRRLGIENFCGDNFPAWVMKMEITSTEGKWMPLNKLVKIKLSGRIGCVSLPMLGELPLLRDLELYGFEKLRCLISSSISLLDQLGSSRKTTTLSPSLRSLQLINMKSLEKWTDADINSSTMLSPVLKRLYIKDCPKITHLDEDDHHPLTHLSICNCKNLESIRSIHGLTSLESLYISHCDSLLSIADLEKKGGSLKELEILYCDNLTSLPGGFGDLTLLNWLELGPFSMELHSFPSLKGIDKLRQLQSLTLYGLDHWESIPEEIQHLTSLTKFKILKFGIRELPMWLTNMSSIENMEFSDCKRLSLEEVKEERQRKQILSN